MSHHMPAPWTLTNTSAAQRGPVQIVSRHGLTVGTAYTVDDARVMAAAPSLLETLKLFVGEHGHMPRCKSGPEGKGCTPLCLQVRLAIGKAEGGEA